MNLHGKTFRVLRNDGPGAEVTTDTVFHFRQEQIGGQAIVHADYRGGGVVMGKLVGVLEGEKMRHCYVQVNAKGELQRGSSTDELELTPEGKLRLIDRWQWETKVGSGVCILEEI